MLLALNLTAPALPLMWVQTANDPGYGGARGMPAADFIQTATDFMNTYKVQFLETYAAVWSDPTSGAANVSFTNGTLIPALIANAQTGSNGGSPRGELHTINVSTLATGPVGRRLIPAGNSDVWYRFVLDDITVPSAVTTLLLSQPSSGSNNGDLSLRINASKQLLVRWNASGATDWTDTTALSKGDLVEIRHLLAGAGSGYEVWVNGALRRKNYVLSAPTGATVSFVNLGPANAANIEAWFYRFGAANAKMGSPSTVNPVNMDSPVVTVSNPVPGQVYTQQTTITVSASASDNDGISKMEVQLDGGAWQAMTQQGSAWVATLTLTGTAGTSQAHGLSVRATDNFVIPTQQAQTVVSVGVTVNIPGADTIAPTINVTSPSTVASSVSNATATQAISGTVTDNVGVTSLTINGTAVTVGGGGVFTTTLPLVVGSNSFVIVAKDAAGNTKSVTYTVTRQTPVSNNAPALTVNTPQDGDNFPVGTSTVVLTGQATDSDGTVTGVTYSYDGSAPVALTLSSGSFTKSIPVTPGQHTITVTATDNTGLTASTTLNINVASPIPVDTSGGSGFNAALDFGKGQVLVRV